MNKKEELEFYLERLEEEINASEVSNITVCTYADAIARIYDSFNQPEEANRYFSLAAEACLNNLHHGLGQAKTLPKSRGDDRLECARILWRAGDDRAKGYFQKSLKEYRKGYDSESNFDRVLCWYRSAFCLLFQGEFNAARDSIVKSLEVENEAGHTFENDPSRILMDIITSINEGDKIACKQAISSLETFMKRQNISVYGRNPPHIVDVYLFLKRKVETMFN